jgi:hypothetical protein
MDGFLGSRSLHVRIGRTPGEVYAFAAAPENLPVWAAGLGGSVRHGADGGWVAETPHGPLALRFAAPNEHGVLDHWVTGADGVEAYVPMRVFANGSGSEVVFTLFQLPGVSDASFAEDCALVRRDLEVLKRHLEA